MKKIIYIMIFLLCSLLIGCASSTKGDEDNKTVETQDSKDIKGKKKKKKEKKPKEVVLKELSVTRPSNIDLYGAKTIAIIPITGASDFSSKCTANYITISLENKIKIGQYLVLLDSDSIYESDVIANPDVYLKGEIKQYKTSTEIIERNDDEKKKFYTRKTVDFAFSYQIVNMKTKQVIYQNDINQIVTSDLYENKFDVPDAYELLKPTLDEIVVSISNNIQPYSEIQNFTLLVYKKKNNLNSEMKSAYQFAVNGMIEESFEKYMSIYSENNLIEAGYNAAILLASMGNYDEAYKLANNLIYKFRKRNRLPGKLLKLRKELIETEKSMSKKRISVYEN